MLDAGNIPKHPGRDLCGVAHASRARYIRYSPRARGISAVPSPALTDVPQMQTLTPLKSQKTEVFETLRKVVPVTSLFMSYMVPRPDAVKAEMRKCGSGKRDYRMALGTGYPLVEASPKNSRNFVR